MSALVVADPLYLLDKLRDRAVADLDGGLNRTFSNIQHLRCLRLRGFANWRMLICSLRQRRDLRHRKSRSA